jgi:hypothetical protein
MWLLAMAGIPLLIISLDVLTNRRLTNWLREIIFRPDDTQIFEPRDVIWAWVMFLFAAVIVVWGLKELFIPTKVVECRDEGLALKINGPFRQPSIIEWNDVVDVQGAEVDDEGDRVSLFVVQLLTKGDLPDSPWGARWLDERELGVLADDWAQDPQEVADQVADYAVEVSKRRAAAQRQSIWLSRETWGFEEE